MHKRTKRAKKTNKEGRAINIYLTGGDEDLAEQLGALEKRSLSNLIAYLIHSEGVRRGLVKTQAKAA